MTDAFPRALAFALRPEHDGQPYHVTPGDTGGATAYGVIKPTLSTYLGRPVTDDDIRALTPESVAPIYRRYFWDANRCGDMAAPLGFMVFDFACGSGGWAAKRLQRLVGAQEDGAIGPRTLALVNAAWADRRDKMLHAYHDARTDYYSKVPGNERWRGWYFRADKCLAEALAMYREGVA
jgi:lysozyme family protein